MLLQPAPELKKPSGIRFQEGFLSAPGRAAQSSGLTEGHNGKAPSELPFQGGFKLVAGGADEARTRDLWRDRREVYFGQRVQFAPAGAALV